MGSRWRHQSGAVYEFTGTEPDVDPCYHYAMRLVEPARMSPTPVGYVMHVELAWFELTAKKVV